MKALCNYRFRLFLLLVMLFSSVIHASNPDTITVVNWNLEWFADGSTHDPAFQTNGVRRLMDSLDADIYALEEVVNTDSLDAIVTGLGSDFSYYVSAFGSFASSPADPDYTSAQKLAFVYRKSKVQVLDRRAFLKGSPTSYYEFASGRYPFLVETLLRGKDSVWQPVTFIVLHAKADGDNSSCNRRSDGAQEIKDSLDAFYPDKKFLLLGDFNDDLDVSICSAAASNYKMFVNDSAHYKALTLPLSLAGINSIYGYESFLDHVVVSDEMYPYYVAGSAHSLHTYVTDIIPSYSYDISDHFPTITKYVLEESATFVEHVNTAAYVASNNPVSETLCIYANAPVSCSLINDLGLLVWTKEIQTGSQRIDVSALPSGIYFLCSKDRNNSSFTKIIITH